VIASPDTAASPCLLLAGPTASGKSEVALLLAEKVGGEIISVDSMQVYRGMDIGTAKPLPEQRSRVPHHLVDVVDITDPFDAAQFVRLARTAVQDIQRRGKLPILSGGTGLYYQAFLLGLGEAPPGDPVLRAELQHTPLPELLRELSERDAKAYEKIDRKNLRRVVRAVEVCRLTGKPYSTQRADWQRGERAQTGRIEFFGLRRAPEDLRSRIDERVEQMFGRGLVAETGQLLKQGLQNNPVAMQALGYRQVVEFLHGQRSLAQTIETVKTRTRQYAKRQMTWFRTQPGLSWIDVEADENLGVIAQRIAEKSAFFR
jgi:tRNA dimethylallyltransferase